MPKSVKLLLVENVEALGIVGDVVNVRTGYARNYLLPRNLATTPSEDLIKSLTAKRAEAEKQLAILRKQREELSGKLQGVEITLTRACNDQGILYASITQGDIATALSALGHAVKPRDVRINQTMKRVDNYDVHVRLDSDLDSVIKVHVKADRELDQAKGGDEKPDAAAEADERNEPKSFRDKIEDRRAARRNALDAAIAEALKERPKGFAPAPRANRPQKAPPRAATRVERRVARSPPRPPRARRRKRPRSKASACKPRFLTRTPTTGPGFFHASRGKAAATTISHHAPSEHHRRHRARTLRWFRRRAAGRPTSEDLWKNNCASCHGARAEGVEGKAKSLLGIDEAPGSLIETDRRYHDAVRNGIKGIEGHNFSGSLNEAQSWATINRLREFQAADRRRRVARPRKSTACSPRSTPRTPSRPWSVAASRRRGRSSSCRAGVYSSPSAAGLCASSRPALRANPARSPTPCRTRPPPARSGRAA